MLVDRVRDIIAPLKTTTDATGSRSTAQAHEPRHAFSTATMMFGHAETLAERVEHMERVPPASRTRPNGFTAFILWTFQPENTAMWRYTKLESFSYLRTAAVARLYLDNISNLQASWVTQGPRVAEISLRCGVNDMGSTMFEENVVSAAGTTFAMNWQQIEESIKKLRFRAAPAQRLLRGAGGLIPAAFHKSDVLDILEKAVAGDRLSAEDGVRLFASYDLPAIGWAANRLREERHGNVAYYLKNRHINYSNVCKYDCFFCSPSTATRSRTTVRGSGRSDEVLEHVAPYKDTGLKEFHIVGGVHPDLPFSYYTDMLSALRREHPGIALKAFTAIEIAYFAELTGKSLHDVLAELKEAGLSTCCLAAARKCSRTACATRCAARRRTPTAGSRCTRRRTRSTSRRTCTMLYGHIETDRGARRPSCCACANCRNKTGGLLSVHPARASTPTTTCSGARSWASPTGVGCR